MKVLRNESQSAMNKLQREAERMQQSREMLSGHKLPFPKRRYAFSSDTSDSAQSNASSLDLSSIMDGLDPMSVSMGKCSDGLSDTDASLRATLSAAMPQNHSPGRTIGVPGS